MKAKVFRNNLASTRLITPAGRLIIFTNHKCIAVKQEDMDYLDACAANDNECGVFIDPNEYEVDTEDLTEEGRKEKIRREAITDYIASQQAALKPQGNVTGGMKVGIAGSADVKGTTLDGAAIAALSAASAKPESK